jgi:hypothetical protein
MGVFGNVVGKFRPVQQPVRQRQPLPTQGAWVLRIEGFAFQTMSIVFSVASAYAILQVFVGSSIDIMHLDVGRYADGLLLAIAFGAAGYFLSRSIAYRLMAGQMAWSYILPCAVVEFVEIYCNYMVGVSELHLNDFLVQQPVDERGALLFLGRIVMSCIPAMTLTLSVAHMDYERKKLGIQSSQPKYANPGPSPLGGNFQGVPNQPRQRQAPQNGYAGGPVNGANPPRRGVNSQGQPAGVP